MPVTLETRALGDVYRRLTGLCDVLDVDVTDSRAGVTALDLTKDQKTLDAFVDAEADRIRDRHGVAVPRHVAASRALHDYAWSVALLTSGPWYLERTVPRIRLEDIGLDLGSGACTITPRTDLACLAGAPQAGRPGVRTVPDEEALRAELRSAVADHMAPSWPRSARSRGAGRAPCGAWWATTSSPACGIWAGSSAARRKGCARPPTCSRTACRRTRRAQASGSSRTNTADGTPRAPAPAAACSTPSSRMESCLTCPRTADAERLRRLA